MVMQNECLNHFDLKSFKNARRQTAAILKTVKSPYFCNHSTDFDELWHSDAYSSSEYDVRL